MTRTTLQRPPGRLVPLSGALALAALVGCEPPDTVEVEESRFVDSFHDPVLVGAGSAQRFGDEPASSPAPSEVPLEWDVPEGWRVLEPTDIRLANLQPGGHPDAECTLSILPGSGGGLEANVNRWRKQMGVESLEPAEIDALPRRNLLGMAATLVEVDEGAYSGMGDVGREGFGMRGLVLPTEAFTIFVKMTGPADVVAAEAEAFDAFCASIRGTGGGGHFEGDGHDHSAHAGDDPHAAAPPAAAAGTPAAEAETVTSGSWRYELQPGWTDVGARSMRSVNLLAGKETQCYVIELAGEAGGELPNLNRWASEVGADPLDEADVAALERVELLGEPAPLLEVSGNYSGMGEGGGPGTTVLGTLLVRPSSSVFVKMVGPGDEVAAHRDRFLAFCESLEPNS